VLQPFIVSNLIINIDMSNFLNELLLELEKAEKDNYDAKEAYNIAVANYAKTQKIVDAINLLIEAQGINKEQPTHVQPYSAIRLNEDFAEIFGKQPLTRRQIIVNALKSIGQGITDDVAKVVVSQNPEIPFDKAKKWARAELSLLASKPDSGVTGTKVFGSNNYNYKYTEQQKSPNYGA
jgi:hypothetical protein